MDLGQFLDIALEIAYQLFHISMLVMAAFAIFRIAVKKSMNNFLLKMHSDDKGTISWMRIGGTITILSAISLAFYQLNATGEINETLIIGMLTVGFGGKAAQSFSAKEKIQKTTNSDEDQP